jgi:hypothetical protein
MGEYVMSVLFPEYYPAARLPWAFPIPTAVFSQREHFYFDCNPDGNWGLVFIPQHNDGLNAGSPFLEIYTDPAFAASNWGAVTTTYSDNIGTYYDKVRLTAAVIVITYLGSLDDSTGVMVGGLDYGYIAGSDKTIDNVEDGYYIQRSSPFEGLRHVWWARDNKDFEFSSPGIAFDSAILAYGQAFNPSTKLRIDIERHWEGIPNAEIRDYIEVKRAPHTGK